MKRTAAIIILILFAMLLWDVAAGWPPFFLVDVDGDDGGPLGTLLGLVFGGGGLLLAGAIMLLVGLVLAAVFASVGVVLLAVLALVAAVVGLVAAPFLLPFLLPLLVPVAIVWWLVDRSRRNRAARGVV
jgi:hypothetical protein